MWFGRSWDDLVCVRHTDGRTEQINADLPHGVSSADGSAIAYWNSQKHELHIFLVASHSTCLSKVCRARICGDCPGPGKGALFPIFPTGANPPGIRSFDVDSSKRNLFSGSFIGLVPSPDAEHVVAVSGEESRVLPSRTASTRSLRSAIPVVARSIRAAGSSRDSRDTSIAEQSAPPTGTQATVMTTTVQIVRAVRPAGLFKMPKRSN